MTARHLLGQIAIGGGNDTRPQRDALDAAHPLELALLQYPQELRLQPERHVADLIQEERAVAGQLALAQLLDHRTREGTALMPEELRFQQRVDDRRAVDGHEGPQIIARVAVDDVGHQLLASAALTLKQHGGQ